MDRYEPPSNFLKMIINGEISLAGDKHAEDNLSSLINMTRDSNTANRDWATMLLSQQSMDTENIRDALLAAACDEDEFVRAEAILGLVYRDRAIALPLIKKELSNGYGTVSVFEAAAIAADPCLVNYLRDYLAPSGDAYLDGLVLDALHACENSSLS